MNACQDRQEYRAPAGRPLKVFVRNLFRVPVGGRGLNTSFLAIEIVHADDQPTGREPPKYQPRLEMRHKRERVARFQLKLHRLRFLDVR